MMTARSNWASTPGSDIVDLRAANPLSSKPYYSRFAERICTGSELDWLRGYARGSSRRRHRALWSLWAAKEAVFKTRCSQAMLLRGVGQNFRTTIGGLRRACASIDFVPRRIEILPDARLRLARVAISDGSGDDWIVHYRHGAGWVHAVCSQPGAGAPRVWIGRRNSVPGCESVVVRELLLDGLCRSMPMAPSALSIYGGRSSGLAPWLRYRRGGLCARIPISLSHDGDWLAAAIAVNGPQILFAGSAAQTVAYSPGACP